MLSILLSRYTETTILQLLLLRMGRNKEKTTFFSLALSHSIKTSNKQKDCSVGPAGGGQKTSLLLAPGSSKPSAASAFLANFPKFPC